MKRHNGWTLIELVLTLLLIGIFGSVILRVSFSQDIFARYLFQDRLIDATAQAKTTLLYAQTPIQLEIRESKLWFVPMGQTEHAETQTWSVKIPQGVTYDTNLFPLMLGAQPPGSVLKLEFISPDRHLIIDTQTAVAYAKAK